MHIPSTIPFSANGRTYAPPVRPIVVICIDGCADEYLDAALDRGLMPHLQRMAVQGFRGLARGALPSFTNVNNCAIVTGTSPRETGISGNYILDPASGQEVMTNSPDYLRNETILSVAARAGRKVAMITAKDKLRSLLSKDMRGIAFSAERADEATVAANGIANVELLVGRRPPIYSAEASLYVLRAGVTLLNERLADFCYLTLTDYIQHQYAPAERAALDFYAAIDQQLGRLQETGAVVAITADHGMNAKCDEQGQPRIIFLESQLTERWGAGCRVICPVTDPYVVHHGALGSAVTVYLADPSQRLAIAQWMLDLDGITEVYERERAVQKCEMPPDRIGDLFVLAARDWVIGRTPQDHDLSKLTARLRSHGGRYEEMVPLILSVPLNERYAKKAAGDPRNFDVFDFVCNGIAELQRS